MKRTIAVAILFTIALLSGCGKMADPIDIPSKAAVTSIEVMTSDGAGENITETAQIEMIMNDLNAAEPTRLQSVNDQPTNVDVYGTVSINKAGDVVVLYYYDKDGKHYPSNPDDTSLGLWSISVGRNRKKNVRPVYSRSFRYIIMITHLSTSFAPPPILQRLFCR